MLILTFLRTTMTICLFFPQHSPTDMSGDAAMTVPDRPTAAGAPGQPVNAEQPNNQETKPKKKRKKKAKAADREEDDGGPKAAGEEDKLEFPGTGSDVGGQVPGAGIIEGSSPPAEEKKKRKKKPKEKAEGKEPKEPKTPKTPKTPKEPKEPKEKKTKSSTPKAKTPKKTR